MPTHTHTRHVNHIFNMAQQLGDFAKRFGSGAPKGVGLGLKLLIGAGALGYGIKESIYTGKSITHCITIM